MEKHHSKLLYDHSKPYKGINNEDIEKQCCETTDVMQSLEYQSQISSSHMEFPYDVEPLRDYTMSYHPISLNDQYDGVVNLHHHSNL